MIVRILVEVVSDSWGVLFAAIAYSLLSGGIAYAALRFLEEARAGDRREKAIAYASALAVIPFGYALGWLSLLAAVHDLEVTIIGGILAAVISVASFVRGWRDGDIPYLLPERPKQT